MNCDRTHFSRQIDYSAKLKFDGAAALRKQIVCFVRGIKGPRQNPVTERQIVKWFRGTPPDFVRKQLTEVCFAGQIRQCMKSLSSNRRFNGSYVYEIV